MNKIFCTILILTLMLSFTACAEKRTKENEKALTEASVELPPKSGIMCLVDDKVYYYTEKLISENLLNVKVFSKNLINNNIVELIEFKNTTSVPIDATLINQNIYFIFDKASKSIFEINTKNNEVKQIFNVEEDLSLMFIKGLKDSIAILKILQTNNDVVEYTIEILDLKTHESKKIIKKEAKENSGTVITYIYTDDEYIYALEGVRNDDDISYIVKYNENGDFVNKYDVDLTEFLDINEIAPELSSDFPVNLYVYENYFIINTANTRKIIFELEKDELKKIEISEKLYKNVPSSYQILMPSNEKLKEDIYFYNFINGSLINFNTKTEEFKEIMISLKEATNNYLHLNENNQLFKEQFNIENQNEMKSLKTLNIN